MKNFRNFNIIIFIGLIIPLSAWAQKPDNPLIWESEIRKFEKQDSLNMPDLCGIVFTGSSSIRGWRSVEQDFPDHDILNRGFGGSRIGDATYYFDELIGKYKPTQVVLYSGDNDIASGKTPEMVFKKFKDFVNTLKKELPKTELVFLSIKPSLARWNMYDDMAEANKIIKRYAFWHRDVTFVDISTAMLGEDNKPRSELFIGDGLHMTLEGYKLWTKILRPYLGD